VVQEESQSLASLKYLKVRDCVIIVAKATLKQQLVVARSSQGGHGGHKESVTALGFLNEEDRSLLSFGMNGLYVFRQRTHTVLFARLCKINQRLLMYLMVE